MMGAVLPKSAAKARREGHWQRLEAAIRGAQTFAELESVWKREQDVIRALPLKWQQHAADIKEERRRELGDTMARQETSLQYLDEGYGL